MNVLYERLKRCVDRLLTEEIESLIFGWGIGTGVFDHKNVHRAKESQREGTGHWRLHTTSHIRVLGFQIAPTGAEGEMGWDGMGWDDH
jgi:hypothetical protein